jgi:hypothetical protein
VALLLALLCAAVPLDRLLASGGKLDEPTCRQATGWRGAILDGCAVRRAANGKAAIIQLASECGGDSCSTETWVVVAGRPPVHLAAAVGTVEVLPSLDAAISDHVDHDPRVGWCVRLVRIPLGTPTQRHPFADCMSPTLSPDARWIVCRSPTGDVLRVPVTGGPASLLHRVPGEEPFTPYAFVYPEAVRFRADRRMVIPRSGQPPLVPPR